MKHIRKGLAVLIAAALLMALPIGVQAQSGLIYESRTKQTVTSGATLENITRFTTEGWLNINVLRVNLGDPYIKVEGLANSQSIDRLATVLSTARQNAAVAAVNASFFTPTGDGSGHPMGPIVLDGDIKSASSSFNMYSDAMGSFSIDNLDKILYSYWKTDIKLLTPAGVELPVAQYNKPSGQLYNDITILDKKWSSTTIGVSEKYPDIVEMLVDGGKVAEIRQGQPAAAIPANGYAVVTRGSEGQKLVSRFQAGDPVNMTISTTPDWNNMKLSLTGGAILVKDGKIPASFSFDPPDISKRNPRTVIGSTKDGKQLILVTVDGRQNSSIGMTQSETAQLMVELGAYNALNLDGGGSTTMVARKPGRTTADIVNSPSESSRSVSTMLGIFSIAPSGPLAGLIIETEDNNVFVNTARSFSIKGYDRYFNPVEVKPEQIKWTVSGVKGSFAGSSLTPSTVGDGTVTAAVGSIKASVPVSSLSAPVKLALSTGMIKLPVGQSKSITVTGTNKNGYMAKINPENVKWTVSSKSGSCDKGSFKGVSRGTGYVDASLGKVHAYAAFSITSDVTSVIDKFEAKNGVFTSYPDTVKGSYAISSEQFHGGKASGKLKYDFTDTEGTRAAYLSFPDKGLQLQTGTSRLGIWVYNTHENSNWVRAELTDAAGAKKVTEFSSAMDWTGWKYLEASLDGITTPAFLTKLYVVQVNPIADSGSVYFDDLSVTVSGYPAVDTSKIPKNTVPVDDANKKVTFAKGTSNFRFGVFGSSHEPRNPLEKVLTLKMTDKINKYLDAAVYTGSNAANAVKGVKKTAVAAGTGYKSVDIKNSRFIQLDMSKGGLRVSNPDQWKWLLSQLDTAKGSNVFVVLQSAPENFTDSLEAKLLKNTLAEYKKKSKKNVWVFYKGSANGSELDRGVRYITCAGLDADGITSKNTDAAKYILVTVMGGNVTFEIKTIV